MRYTTIIDITEFPVIWRNPNAARLYFFMAMKCGYHDDDRDVLEMSLRTMAGQTDLTLSAIRNALGQLQKAGLATKDGDTWRVKKWVSSEAPTPRRQSTTAKSKSDGTDIARQKEQQIEEYQRQLQDAVRACSIEELNTWLEELKQNRTLRHQRVYLKANKANIAWLEKVIEVRTKKGSEKK